jgi:hypothetical protein
MGGAKETQAVRSVCSRIAEKDMQNMNHGRDNDLTMVIA